MITNFLTQMLDTLGNKSCALLVDQLRLVNIEMKPEKLNSGEDVCLPHLDRICSGTHTNTYLESRICETTVGCVIALTTYYADC